jgi:hypothetical protein
MKKEVKINEKRSELKRIYFMKVFLLKKEKK